MLSGALVAMLMHERLSLAEPEFLVHFYLANSGVLSSAWLGQGQALSDYPKTSLIMIVTFGHESFLPIYLVLRCCLKYLSVHGEK
jgi:hypothetical protein